MEKSIEEKQKEFDTIFANNLTVGNEPFNALYLKIHLVPVLKKWIADALTQAIEGERKTNDDKWQLRQAKDTLFILERIYTNEVAIEDYIERARGRVKFLTTSNEDNADYNLSDS